MTLESKVKINENVFLQEVDDETILLNSETQEYFSLNEIGTLFYHLLQEHQSLEEVLSELKESFDVDEDQLKKDLFSFVKALEERNLLKLF